MATTTPGLLSPEQLAKTNNVGLLATQTTTPAVATGNAAVTDNANYYVANANTAPMQQVATPAKVTANPWAVKTTDYNPTTDSSWSLAGNYIKEDNPISQVAATKARQSMNNSGLLSSSMTAGAVTKGLVESVQPYALQDAAASLQNKQFNVGQENTVGVENAKMGLDADKFNTTMSAQADQFNANWANDITKLKMDAGLKLDLQNKLNAFTEQQKVLDRELDRYTANLSANATMGAAALNAASAERRDAAQIASNEKIVGMNNASADNRQKMSVASTVSQNIVTANGTISNVIASKDIPDESKSLIIGQIVDSTVKNNTTLMTIGNFTADEILLGNEPLKSSVPGATVTNPYTNKPNPTATVPVTPPPAQVAIGGGDGG